jgi:elongation factor Ts
VATTDDIKRLREETSAGIMDCKRALEESGGNYEKAKTALAELGLARAAKRSERETAQGLVEAYIHAGGRIGSMVEVNCETDFVARTDDFKVLAHDIAMQVAAVSTTLAVSEEDLPSGAEGAPEEIILMKQPFIKDGSKTIADLVNAAISKTGENIRVRRFARFELGQ